MIFLNAFLWVKMIEKYIYYRGKIVFKFEYHLFFYDCGYLDPEVNTNLHA